MTLVRGSTLRGEMRADLHAALDQQDEEIDAGVSAQILVNRYSTLLLNLAIKCKLGRDDFRSRLDVIAAGYDEHLATVAEKGSRA